MATVTRLRINIGQITGCPHPLDSDELSRRVAAELGDLLARAPLPRTPPPGSVIKVPSSRVHTGSAATEATIAHSIARHLYTSLYTATPCR